MTEHQTSTECREKLMPALPPFVAWTLGAIGAFVVLKLISREWQRINGELDNARPVRVTDPERAGFRPCAVTRGPANTGPIADRP